MILTPRGHGCSIGDKSDEGQDAALRVEMGNVGSDRLIKPISLFRVVNRNRSE